MTRSLRLDHNHECVGCGAHFSNPCDPTCPFESGAIGAAVILRAAAGIVRGHPAGIGYSIRDALWATATDLAGADRAQEMTDQAHRALTTYLVSERRDEGIRSQLVYRHGLFSHLDEIARSLYAAAAQHDGIAFDADAFGEFPY